MAISESRRGFTLIELLVVIGVIAVLAGLVLPALARARATARRVECISRQKQWTHAFLAYKDDHEDQIPREGHHPNGQVFWNNWANVEDPVSKDVWYNGLEHYVGVRAAAAYVPSPERGNFYHRSSLFHCPATRFPDQVNTPLYQIVLFSMAMNSQLIQPTRAPTISFNLITRASQTVLFLDNLLQGEARVSQLQAANNLGQPAAYADRFAGGRHGRGGNLAFADGHAEWFRASKVVELRGPNAGGPILPEVDVVWDLEVP